MAKEKEGKKEGEGKKGFKPKMGKSQFAKATEMLLAGKKPTEINEVFIKDYGNKNNFPVIYRAMNKLVGEGKMVKPPREKKAKKEEGKKKEKK